MSTTTSMEDPKHVQIPYQDTVSRLMTCNTRWPFIRSWYVPSWYEGIGHGTINLGICPLSKLLLINNRPQNWPRGANWNWNWSQSHSKIETHSMITILLFGATWGPWKRPQKLFGWWSDHHGLLFCSWGMSNSYWLDLHAKLVLLYQIHNETKWKNWIENTTSLDLVMVTKSGRLLIY